MYYEIDESDCDSSSRESSAKRDIEDKVLRDELDLSDDAEGKH